MYVDFDIQEIQIDLYRSELEEKSRLLIGTADACKPWLMLTIKHFGFNYKARMYDQDIDVHLQVLVIEDGLRFVY